LRPVRLYAYCILLSARKSSEARDQHVPITLQSYPAPRPALSRIGVSPFGRQDEGAAPDSPLCLARGGLFSGIVSVPPSSIVQGQAVADHGGAEIADAIDPAARDHPSEAILGLRRTGQCALRDKGLQRSVGGLAAAPLVALAIAAGLAKFRRVDPGQAKIDTVDGEGIPVHHTHAAFIARPDLAKPLVQQADRHEAGDEQRKKDQGGRLAATAASPGARTNHACSLTVIRATSRDPLVRPRLICHEDRASSKARPLQEVRSIPMHPSRDIARLIEIMAALRDPETGCSWDKVQTFQSIAPYTIEEAFEVADAIERHDMLDLEEELGDLLLQVVYHARMAEEVGSFAFGDVVMAITAKMIRRHPHVFGSEEARSAGAAKGFWETIKAEEKRTRAERRRAAGEGDESPTGLLDDVPAGMTSLARAAKLQQRASTVGFDWNDPRAVLAKIQEEIGEIEQELDAETISPARMRDEIGDLLFAVANLARHADVDPDAALRGTNEKFTRRFRHIEHRLAEQQRSPKDATLDEMETLWTEAKGATRVED
jgi:ATP diphosphatase